MGQTSKTLLTALIISLFSLSAIQGIKIVTNNSSQVLGETTAMPPISNLPQGVPCATINSWQQRYCSNIGPSGPIPTNFPMPTPTLAPNPTPSVGCVPSATRITVGVCKYDYTLYSSAQYQCQDKINYVTVGDPSGANCYKPELLLEQATAKCAAYCGKPVVVGPTPTITQCKTGVNSLSMGPYCKTETNRFGSARFGCYDGYSGTVGDISGINCYTTEELKNKAESACFGRTSCSGTNPTPYPMPAVTVGPKPTSYPGPTYVPMPAVTIGPKPTSYQGSENN